jgi:tetratricopeptide (TPR) repeat protein
MRISGSNIRKMLKVLSTILFSLSWVFTLSSQDIHQIKGYADDQFNKGNYTIALKEYQRVLLFDREKQFQELYEQIASIYYNQNDFRNAYIYYDFAWKAIQNDSIKLELSFRKTLCNFKEEEYLLALTELLDLPDRLSPYFEYRKNLYFAICYFGLDDDEQSLQYFSNLVDSAGIDLLEDLFSMLAECRKKYDPDRLELMSIFLPGLGQTVAGDFASGLNSVLLLGAISAYSLYTGITYGLLDGTLVLLTGGYRYYSGGHKKAFNLGVERIEEMKNHTYLHVLEIINNHSLN